MKKLILFLVLISLCMIGIMVSGHSDATNSTHQLNTIDDAQNSSSYYTNVYIVSTYPGQFQQLFAEAGQSNILMYPYWNITMFSESPHAVNYTIYINGNLVSQGKFTGTANVNYHVNASIATAQIGVGFIVYRFTDLPISSIPLNVLYAPPPPVPIYTQIFLDIFQVKAMIGAFLSLAFAVLVVGRLTVAKKERTINGG